MAKKNATTPETWTEIGRIPLSEKAAIVASHSTDGRVGLRLFSTTESYTGPTKTGMTIPADQVEAISSMLAGLAK